jgi:hypothetical protein
MEADMSDSPLLSWDELRILESIVRDTTKSPEERQEASLRLEAQIDMRVGFMEAKNLGTIQRFRRACQEYGDSLKAMNHTLGTLVDRELAELTEDQRRQVDHLVGNEDECVLDAIALVTGDLSDRDGEAPGNPVER